MQCWNCGAEYKLSLRIITRPFTWPRISSWFSGRLATSSDCVSASSPDMPPHQHIITIHKVIDHVGCKQRPLGADVRSISVHFGHLVATRPFLWDFRIQQAHFHIYKYNSFLTTWSTIHLPSQIFRITTKCQLISYHPSSFSNLLNLQPNGNSSLSWTHCQIEATFPSHFNNFMEAH